MSNQVNAEELFIRARPIHVRRTQSLLAVLVLMIASFIAWANWATLDEQVRTSGKVIVSSRSQKVQAVDGGVLSRMLVREGQSVEAGDLLAELDRTRFAAGAQELRGKALSLRANVERLTAEINDEPLEFSDEVEQDPRLVRIQRELHKRRLRLQNDTLSSIKSALSLAKQELAALEDLASTGDASQSELLQARRRVVELQGEWANSRNEYQREAQARLGDLQSELQQTLQQLKQRDEALDATRIRAPMAGTVKNIEISTIGAVLKSGEELMQIVPSNEPMLVEARLMSRDVAFVRPGLRANVKLDAYDFTVYGSLTGAVTYISPDTIDTDLKQDEQPYYRALVEITELPQRPGMDPIEVIPGMTATIEIITGEKTVAQYLLKPLRRGSAAALTER